MDIQVESSVVLAAMIAVLLAFIVPSLIRRGRRTGEPALVLASTPDEAFTSAPGQAEETVERVGPDPADLQPAPAPKNTRTHDTERPRRNTMATPARTRSAAPTTAVFRIRYGRLAIALTGVLAALALVVGGLLAPFGILSGFVPLVGLIVLVGSFMGLRALAVRDRRRKVLARMDAIFHEAMDTQPAEPVIRRQATKVFDAREQETAAAQAPEANGSVRHHAPLAAATAPATWEPVAVPKPTYVGAAKAERPAPEPLPAGEEKKPQKATSILAQTRIAEQEAQLAEQAERAERGEEVRAVPEAPRRRPAAQSSGMNLDAVLQRRRA
ncbi:hypothetical protein ACTXOR_11130 [Arthrobacter rhombi]|uniref:hypothetical protein n=1 Tax=Arthrobacter rhombi TaxID=71253 RepID=UPI003FCF00A1